VSWQQLNWTGWSSSQNSPNDMLCIVNLKFPPTPVDDCAEQHLDRTIITQCRYLTISWDRWNISLKGAVLHHTIILRARYSTVLSSANILSLILAHSSHLISQSHVWGFSSSRYFEYPSTYTSTSTSTSTYMIFLYI
jgi:hypothetical protein